MKKFFKNTLLSFFVVSITLILSFTIRVNAQVDSTTTLQELQSKINSAMLGRQTTYSVTYSGNSSTLQSDITSVINNIYNSDDYLHYTSKGYSYSASIAGGVSTINFTFNYWNTQAMDTYVESTITQVINSIITSGMNDFEKEKVIHDWILTHVAYDTTLVQHSDYAALVSPYKTVCQGYALLSYKMLNKAGIETKIIEGTASGQAHAWNLVKLDGNWYHFDATWDDPIPDVVGRTTYGYYNLTDGQIKVNHTWTKTYPLAVTDFKDTIASKIISDSSNASLYQGLSNALELNLQTAEYTVSDSAALSVKIQEAIKNNQNKIRVRYINGSTLSTDIQNAIKGITNITSYSYYKSDYIRTTLLGDIILDLTVNYYNPVSASSIGLSSSNITLAAGASSTLTATVLPSNASNKNIIWTSSNTNVATVINGVVKAINGGTATITAKTVDGGYIATCTVNVVQGISSISITSTTPYVKVGGEDITLTAIVNPVTATNKSLIWKSSNPNIATVDENGKVHAVAYGAVTITATSAIDSTKVGRYTVIVPVPVTGIAINSTSSYVKMGSSLSLTVIYNPTNATIKTATWNSSDLNVAKVSSTGVVTPIAPGIVTITAVSTDGNIVATKTLEVIYGITGITLDKTSTYLRLGETDLSLLATVNPTNATYKSLKWTSSNPNVATVDENGNVHAVSYGTVTITVTSVQDPTKVARCTVIVPVPVTGITITSPSNYVKMGSTLPLTVIFNPTNATIKTVTWSSSDLSVAKVSSTGIVTPIAPGIVTITAVSTDGNIVAIKTLEVIYGITGITLDKTSTYLRLGETDLSLIATVNPTNATYKALKWTSSNPNIATVDGNGKVHAVAYGTVTITATSVQDSTKVARCTVVVLVPVTGLTITSSSNYVKMGSSLLLTAVVIPTNATIKTVTWSSSDLSVAKVSSTGLVTPIATGTVTITAVSTDGNIVATKTLSVVYPVTSITLDKISANMILGGADLSLIATVNPTSATDKSLKWTSSNTAIATVDANGKIHAVSAGTVTITVASVQDPTKIVRCTITITK